jgi:hypothetical protein
VFSIVATRKRRKTLAADSGQGTDVDRGKIKRLLDSIANESDTFEELRANPEAIKERFDLSDADMRALEGAHLGIMRVTEFTFITGSTIKPR